MTQSKAASIMKREGRIGAANSLMAAWKRHEWTCSDCLAGRSCLKGARLMDRAMVWDELRQYRIVGAA